MIRSLPILPLTCLLSMCAMAGDPPVSFVFSAERTVDGLVAITAHATVEEGWYLYATELPRDDGPLPTVFAVHLSRDHEVLEGVQEPVPEEGYDPNFAMVVRYHSGDTHFTRSVRPSVEGDLVVTGEVEYMCCNDKTCLPPTIVPFRLEVAAL